MTQTPTPTWEEAIQRILVNALYDIRQLDLREGDKLSGQQPFKEANSVLTQLFKDLVAEAKPLVVVSREALEENGSDTVRLDAVTDGLDQFEQNLLKLLEER